MYIAKHFGRRLLSTVGWSHFLQMCTMRRQLTLASLALPLVLASHFARLPVAPTQCHAGFGVKAGECEICHAGSYQDVEGGWTGGCKQCPAGKFTPRIESHYDYWRQINVYVRLGYTRCEKCPIGYFLELQNKVQNV